MMMRSCVFWGKLLVLSCCCMVMVKGLESLSSSTRQACTKVPRIEVQFLCNRNLLREGFNATEVMESYYTTEIFDDRNAFDNSSTSSGNSSSSNDNDNDNADNKNNNNNNYHNNPTKRWPRPYQIQLYVSVSISTAEDVSSREWYHDQCDFNRNLTLVTIDARGYYHWEEEVSISDGNHSSSNSNSPHHYDEPPFQLQELSYYNTEIRSYFEQTVCDYQPYFYSKIRPWDETKYPIPIPATPTVHHETTSTNEYGSDNGSDSDSDNTAICPALLLPPPLVKGGGQIDYPSSSIHLINNRQHGYDRAKKSWTKAYYYDLAQYLKRTEGYQYDHDLYLLCGGSDHYYDDYEGPSYFFMAIGVISGYIMVLMIKTEYTRPLRYEQLPGPTHISYGNGTVHSSNHSDSDSNSDSDEDSDSGSNFEREIELATF